MLFWRPLIQGYDLSSLAYLMDYIGFCWVEHWASRLPYLPSGGNSRTYLQRLWEFCKIMSISWDYCSVPTSCAIVLGTLIIGSVRKNIFRIASPIINVGEDAHYVEESKIVTMPASENKSPNTSAHASWDRSYQGKHDTNTSFHLIGLRQLSVLYVYIWFFLLSFIHLNCKRRMQSKSYLS